MPEIPLEAIIAQNLTALRARIEGACARCGRSADEVRAVIATKYADLAWIPPVLSAGFLDVGESRPQQLVARAVDFRSWAPEGTPEPRWHLIGHLQRNKVRSVLPHVVCVHSVDTYRLLEAIERIAGEEGLEPTVLLEVNVSGEAAKDGFDPDVLREGLEVVRGLTRVRVAGLMTMAPDSDDPEEARQVFRALRLLRDELAGRLARPLPELSMGMSGDFEVAIEEGATIIRIGSAAFAGVGEV